MDATSILDDIKEKATKLLKLSEPYITRETNVYDVALNKIIVAGIPLDGVVTSTVSADTLTKQEVGIDYYYTAYFQNLEARTLNVSLLPTANCLLMLRLLALKQQTDKGWFNISVHENGKIENVYRAWIIDLPQVSSGRDAEDKIVVFGIKPMFAGVSLIDQPTSTEEDVYSRYPKNESRPQQTGGADDNMVVNEDTGNYEDSLDLVELPEDITPIDP